MDEKMDVKELKEVILAGVAYANVSIEVAKDEKVDWSDALLVGSKIPELFMATQQAIVGASKIPAELEDLSDEEVLEIVTAVASELKVGHEKAKKIVLASLKALGGNALLVKAILEPEAAPAQA